MTAIIKQLNIYNLIRWIVRIHRYPRYCYDIYCNTLVKAFLIKKDITIGKQSWFCSPPIIKNCAGGQIVIGNNVVLCSRSRNTALGVNHPVIIRTLLPNAKVYIGNGVKMSGASICAAKSIKIDDNVLIGANAVIADTDFHAIDSNKRNAKTPYEDLENAAAKPVEIESDVFVGGNSAILKGVHVGKGAVIGFGSVVTKNIPAYTIVAGNPAKIIGHWKND
jgi:acetyltransferase-like isoleucine patch superfamily enzyme